MAAGSTYTPIVTTTLGSNTTKISFTSISGSYTDLVLIMCVGKTAAYTTSIQFNGVTSASYSRTRLSGDGSSISTARLTTSDGSAIALASYGNGTTLGTENEIVHIMNYSSTTSYKTILNTANAASSGLDANVGLYQSTSAITQIDIYSDFDWNAPRANFLTGSVFTIYGITAA